MSESVGARGAGQQILAEAICVGAAVILAMMSLLTVIEGLNPLTGGEPSVRGWIQVLVGLVGLGVGRHLVSARDAAMVAGIVASCLVFTVNLVWASGWSLWIPLVILLLVAVAVPVVLWRRGRAHQRQVTREVVAGTPDAARQDGAIPMVGSFPMSTLANLGLGVDQDALDRIADDRAGQDRLKLLLQTPQPSRAGRK